ncbi:hypothetical protein JF544_18530 [Halobacillus kuroshimensis]|uniref:Permease n=1 Tax=Halobacillus kuroshimensis TaxID=302481 RepID=A0ABS3E0Y7_9BACI|nr:MULTISPECIES: hypothetical protein [Halobacillus]MBN8237246.1 hypothetical protein [Halobacillus kuroshimensis]
MKSNMCRYCYKEIKDRDELVTASSWFRLRPYHYQCFEKLVQDTRTVAGVWKPVNGLTGSVNLLVMLILAVGLLGTDLLGSIGDIIGVIALYPLFLRLLSYMIFERPLPKLAPEKQR